MCSDGCLISFIFFGDDKREFLLINQFYSQARYRLLPLFLFMKHVLYSSYFDISFLNVVMLLVIANACDCCSPYRFWQC